MDRKDYYMNLPKESSGSIAKNRFKIEVLWGIGKILDEYIAKRSYTIFFDYKCDIELHNDNGIWFYQIKTLNDGNFNLNKLCKVQKNKKNSILGKILKLYSPEQNIKLAIVSNVRLKIKNRRNQFKEQCFNDFDQDALEYIEKMLCEELEVKSICFNDVFYIYDNINLLNYDETILGKLVQCFSKSERGEIPNPNAFFNLIYQTATKKASCESDFSTFEEAKKNKGFTSEEFEQLLNTHIDSSDIWIEKTREYIGQQIKMPEKRKYNIALAEIIQKQNDLSLKKIEKEIFKYIEKNNPITNDINSYLRIISEKFDKNFEVEYSEITKRVVYLL
ncbi:dsDNA nuclease domain-containing protein, partial [Metamycoplasma hyosynoviae]